MTDLDPSSPDDLWAISDCLDAIVANPASVHGYSLSRLRDAAVDIRSEADYIEMTAARDALRARKIAAMARAIRDEDELKAMSWREADEMTRGKWRKLAAAALAALEAMEAGTS